MVVRELALCIFGMGYIFLKDVCAGMGDITYLLENLDRKNGRKRITGNVEKLPQFFSQFFLHIQSV